MNNLYILGLYTYYDLLIVVINESKDQIKYIN
jgi:hypothetical protein